MYEYQKGAYGAGVAMAGHGPGIIGGAAACQDEYQGANRIDPPGGLVEQLDKRLAGIVERMYANVAHLNCVADRVMGAQPEKVQGDQAKNNSFCQLDSIRARLADLEHVNEVLGRVTERFSRL